MEEKREALEAERKKKEYKREFVKDDDYSHVRIRPIIILLHILDSIEEFNNNLKEFSKTTNYDKVALAKEIYRASVKGFFVPKKFKEFYLNNKTIIDTINKDDADVYGFIIHCYDDKLEFRNERYNNIQTVYKYIVKNKEHSREILAVLEKMEKLNLEFLIFNESIDFSKEDYSFNVVDERSQTFCYLDNMEYIQDSSDDIIKYKAMDSNFALKLSSAKNVYGEYVLDYCRHIYANNLIFNADSLPDILTAQCIINDGIIGLRIKSISEKIKATNKKIEKLDEINDKKELTECLNSIKADLRQIEKTVSQYNIKTSNVSEKKSTKHR